MSQGEKGISTIELIVTLSIMALISLAATMTTFQVAEGTARSNNRMVAIHQVQNAGYWISRDAQMTDNVTTDNLSPPDFLLLSWTEYDASGNATSHSVRYFFEGLSGGVGRLERNYRSSAGANYNTLIAKYIYYDPADPASTSDVGYQKPVLTVQLAALFKGAREAREYRTSGRPNL